MHLGSTDRVAWKKVVTGIREMCDVCETTLFNIHWVCDKCGFVVCIGCYTSRKEKEQNSGDSDMEPEVHHGPVDLNKRDKYNWMLCGQGQAHVQKKLMLTQIIAGNALDDVGRYLHCVLEEYKIPCLCDCSREKGSALEPTKEAANQNGQNGQADQTNGVPVQASLMNNVGKSATSGVKESGPDDSGTTENQLQVKSGFSNSPEEAGASPLAFLADVALGECATRLISRGLRLD